MENNEVQQRRQSNVSFSKSPLVEGKALIRELRVGKGTSASAILDEVGLFSQRYSAKEMKYFSLETHQKKSKKPVEKLADPLFHCGNYESDFPKLV